MNFNVFKTMDILIKSMLVSVLILLNGEVWSLDAVTQFDPAHTAVKLNNTGQQANINLHTFKLNNTDESMIVNLNGLFTFGKHDREDEKTKLNIRMINPSNTPGKRVITQPGIVSLKELLGQNNSGSKTVFAKLTTVAHGKIHSLALDFDGDQLINFAVPLHGTEINNARVKQSNITQHIDLLSSKGVILHPDMAKMMMTNVINLSNIKEATKATLVDGKILLHTADTIVLSSKELALEAEANAIVQQMKQLYHTSKGIIGNQIKSIYHSMWGLNAGAQGEIINALNCSDGSDVCSITSSTAPVDRAFISSEHLDIQSPIKITPQVRHPERVFLREGSPAI
jgi:hypothetical protein